MSQQHGSHDSEVAMHENDQHGAVPAAENGGHDRSPAAHLGNPPDAHTNPATQNNPSGHPTALRQPPSFVERSGKSTR